jgi:hypothetical protein
MLSEYTRFWAIAFGDESIRLSSNPITPLNSTTRRPIRNQTRGAGAGIA